MEDAKAANNVRACCDPLQVLRRYAERAKAADTSADFHEQIARTTERENAEIARLAPRQGW